VEVITMINGMGSEQLVRDRMATLHGSLAPRRIRTEPRRRTRLLVGRRFPALRRRVPGIIGS
jgi:hypothetical protein